MAASTLTIVRGPKGEAELIEIVETAPSGVQSIQYQVRHQGSTYSYPTLGEAYIAAGEFAGTPT